MHVESRSFKDDRVRPDLEIILADRVVFVDVAIAHPACPSRGATAPLGAARSAEGTKRGKYSPLAARHGATFLAFAVETYGAFGPQAEQVIRLIISHGARFSFGPRGSRGRGLPAQLVAVAIQKGNSLVARCGSLAARSAAAG